MSDSEASVQNMTTSSPIINRLNSMAVKRIRKELEPAEGTKHDSPVIFANSFVDDPLTVEAAIHGPLSTPYENGIFLINIRFSEDYPFCPPKSITFLRATMHPNINESGRFLSEIFKTDFWTPAMTVETILEHVWTRLAIPDIETSDCDPTRSQSYKTNKEQFQLEARDYAIKYAAAV